MAAEHFDAEHIHTTPDGRHFRHGDGCEVDGECRELSDQPFSLFDAIANHLRGAKWDLSDRDAVALTREILEGNHGPVPTKANWLAVTDAVAKKEGCGD